MTTRLPWHDTGVWLMGDTHVHHRQTGLQRVVEQAVRYGCDYLAFTEHSFHAEILEAQPELIRQALTLFPDLVLVGGVEWSTPVGDETRAEQAGLLVPSGSGWLPLMREFLARFDTRVAGIPTSERTFLEALAFLGNHGEGDVRPSVILTHPHRPEAAFTREQVLAARRTGPAIVGLCASSRPPTAGSLEVWPWANEVDGVSDQLFAAGERLVLLAESHFHKHRDEGGAEFWPGEFRRNFVYCPEPSEAGLFRGLRSGASYFVLGGIADDVCFEVSGPGGSVMMGETLTAEAGECVEAVLTFTENVPVDSLELIGNPRGAPQVVASARRDDLRDLGRRVQWRVECRAGEALSYLRARGRSRVTSPYPTDAWFCTNPIWITIPG